jgi:hypothetical protein
LNADEKQAAQKPQRVDYKLLFPVELRNTTGEVIETITTLSLRRLKAKELRTLDNAKGSGTVLLRMIALSSGLPPSTVDEMDAADAANAGATVASFLGGSLPTGES